MSAPTSDEDGIRQAVRALQEGGWVLLHVYDGEDDVPVTNEAEVVEAVTAVEDAYLWVAEGTPTGHRGWVRFVLGNDPDEVICDHTINLAPLDRLTDHWIAEAV